MIWIVADIHGCSTTLEKLVDRIRNIDSQAKFVFIGDYCDRGQNSKQVVDFILGLGDDVLSSLCGNHDDIINWLLNGESWTDLFQYMDGAAATDCNIVSWWMGNGLKDTLNSYGVSSHLKTSGPYSCSIDCDAVADEFREKVPDEHKLFYRNLSISWQNETHFAVHAWANPDSNTPLDIVKGASSPLWTRFPKSYYPTALAYVNPVWDKIGVFGHTPVHYYNASAPIKMEKIRLIDCCAFDNKYLTGYCCESDDWILQPTAPGDAWIRG